MVVSVKRVLRKSSQARENFDGEPLLFAYHLIGFEELTAPEQQQVAQQVSLTSEQYLRLYNLVYLLDKALEGMRSWKISSDLGEGLTTNTINYFREEFNNDVDGQFAKDFTQHQGVTLSIEDLRSPVNKDLLEKIRTFSLERITSERETQTGENLEPIRKSLLAYLQVSKDCVDRTIPNYEIAVVPDDVTKILLGSDRLHNRFWTLLCSKVEEAGIEDFLLDLTLYSCDLFLFRDRVFGSGDLRQDGAKSVVDAMALVWPVPRKVIAEANLDLMVKLIAETSPLQLERGFFTFVAHGLTQISRYLESFVEYNFYFYQAVTSYMSQGDNLESDRKRKEKFYLPALFLKTEAEFRDLVVSVLTEVKPESVEEGQRFFEFLGGFLTSRDDAVLLRLRRFHIKVKKSQFTFREKFLEVLEGKLRFSGIVLGTERLLKDDPDYARKIKFKSVLSKITFSNRIDVRLSRWGGLHPYYESALDNVEGWSEVVASLSVSRHFHYLQEWVREVVATFGRDIVWRETYDLEMEVERLRIEKLPNLMAFFSQKLFIQKILDLFVQPSFGTVVSKDKRALYTILADSQDENILVWVKNFYDALAESDLSFKSVLQTELHKFVMYPEYWLEGKMPDAQWCEDYDVQEDDASDSGPMLYQKSVLFRISQLGYWDIKSDETVVDNINSKLEKNLQWRDIVSSRNDTSSCSYSSIDISGELDFSSTS